MQMNILDNNDAMTDPFVLLLRAARETSARLHRRNVDVDGMADALDAALEKIDLLYIRKHAPYNPNTWFDDALRHGDLETIRSMSVMTDAEFTAYCAEDDAGREAAADETAQTRRPM